MQRIDWCLTTPVKQLEGLFTRDGIPERTKLKLKKTKVN